MLQSLMTENPSSILSSDQFTMLHHSQQPSSSSSSSSAAAAAAAAAVTASFTSDLIHASFVAAHSSSHSSSSSSSSSQPQSQSQPQPRQNDLYNTVISNNNNSSNSNNNNSSSCSNNNTSNLLKKTRAITCITPPKMSTSSLATLEYSIHTSPRRMTRELATVFPSKDLSNLLVVPTFQKCQHDMVAWDAVIAKEKDDRLEDFVRWSTAIHQGLKELGFWSDMTDPASGYPTFSERGRDVYPDVEGCQILLKYDFQNAGCCKVLLHPIWGSKIYPATFFTTAPIDVLLKVLEQVEQENPLSESQ